MANQKVRLEAKVFGIVQGVGFRYFVRKNALALEVSGYIENMPDGSVEVVAEGEKKNLDKLLEVLSRGNSYSAVEKIDYSFKEAHNDFVDFESF